jgi:hypothetical protein
VVRFQSALLRGKVNEGTLGDFSTKILLLKTMDMLEAGLGSNNVHDFIDNLALMDDKMKENQRGMIPECVAWRKSERRDPGGDFGNDSAPENNGCAGSWSRLK